MSAVVTNQKGQAKGGQQNLDAAFRFFNETSQQLQHSYRVLERRVHQLRDELHHSEVGRLEQDRKNTELEQRVRALLDFLPGGVVVLNSRGVVVDANPAASTFLGLNPVGSLWRDLLGEIFAPKNDDGLEVSTRSGRRLSISTSSLGEDGQILLLTDQTETRQLQAELSRNERLSAMGKMVSALAHQIRTPLSAAVLYAAHLCREDLEPENQQRFAHKCLSRLRHMEKQVRDMMLFVKNELPLSDSVSLVELQHHLQEASEWVLQNNACRCRWQLNAADYRLKCNREALISALVNLINNATQAAAAERSLVIDINISRAAVDDQECVLISVADNGQGMTEQTLRKVQELFTTTKAHGTGLGLAVVRSVARAHGGDFQLRSASGVGTIAQLRLPCLNSVSAESSVL